MQSYELQSNAKINVGLNVVGVLENGYHLLDMVMLPIDLFDTLYVKIEKKHGILTIKTDKDGIPTDESNILHKVYKSFYKKAKINPIGMNVFLKKVIPHQAGLGGGSSNGATFLKFLNEYHLNPLTLDELMELGKNIGADIPFFILNRPSRVGGIGEKFTYIENNLDSKILVIKPKFGVSTVVAYNQMKNISKLKFADIDKIVDGLKKNDIKLVEENIQNSLEQALLHCDDSLQNFEEELVNISGMKFFMSGSGSAYYTFLRGDGEKEVRWLKDRFEGCEIFLCDFK